MASKDIAVLVPGRLHEHAVARIEAEFDSVRIERADPGLVTPEMASSVRAVGGMTRIPASFMDALPKLEIIASFGVGYDAVDVHHAVANGIVVTNTPDVLTEEVSDTALGLLINTVRELPRAEKWLRDGRWEKDGAFPLTKMTLRGRTAGIFGMGRIGVAIARRLEALGMPVSYHNRRPVAASRYTYYPTLVDLAAAVDTLICVAPGGAATDKAVNADVLAALGRDGVFINVGRGGTVDQEALIHALSTGVIRAAGLDVFSGEPRVPRELLDLDNACLLPHVGSATVHTRRAMADLMVDNLEAWFARGAPLTPVPEAAGLVNP